MSDDIKILNELPDGSVVGVRDGSEVPERFPVMQPGEPIEDDAQLYARDNEKKVLVPFDIHKGPAQVATDNYRRGWDLTFTKGGDA